MIKGIIGLITDTLALMLVFYSIAAIIWLGITLA